MEVECNVTEVTECHICGFPTSRQRGAPEQAKFLGWTVPLVDVPVFLPVSILSICMPFSMGSFASFVCFLLLFLHALLSRRKFHWGLFVLLVIIFYSMVSVPLVLVFLQVETSSSVTGENGLHFPKENVVDVTSWHVRRDLPSFSLS